VAITNEGFRVPELKTKLVKVAALMAPAALLVTTTVYVVVAETGVS
jgi:hypothetical protein